MSNPQTLSVRYSRHFLEWLHQNQVSLAFTTYQTNRLFLIGLKPDGRLSVCDREFDRPRGLFTTSDRRVMSTCSQIGQLDNLCGEEVGDYLGYDKLYVPSISYTTGDINSHDLINEIVCRSLTMPHSPRFYQEKLWGLNSGSGELGCVENGQFHAVALWVSFGD